MRRRSALLLLFAGLFISEGSGVLAQETTDSSNQAATQSPDELRKVKFLLNSGFSGANAWFLLADDRGYFRDEGIEVEFVDGRGAFTAAGRMAEEGYDFGYGDMQAVIEQAVRDPETSPIGVYMLMDRRRR